MLTLTLSTHYTVQRRILSPVRQQPFGVGLTQVHSPWSRPAYEFVLRASPVFLQSDAEALYGFMQYHQGDRPFWYDGDIWGSQSTPIFIGKGDGSRRQFYLPNRHILEDSLTAYADEVEADPAPEVALRTGLLLFEDPLDTGAVLKATYACRYPCVFVEDSGTLQTEEQLHDALFGYQGIRIREMVP